MGIGFGCIGFFSVEVEFWYRRGEYTPFHGSSLASLHSRSLIISGLSWNWGTARKQKVIAMIWVLKVLGDLVMYAKAVPIHRTSFYFEPTCTIANSRGQCLRYLNGRNTIVKFIINQYGELRASAFKCEVLLPSGETLVVKSWRSIFWRDQAGAF